MEKHLQQQIHTLTETFNQFDMSTANLLVNICISCIKNGNRIIISALGKNAPICEKFIGTLNSAGIDSRFLNTNSAAHGDLGLIKDNDVVIIVSKSGETLETIYLNKIIQNKKTYNWLLTCNKSGTLQKIIKNKIILPIKKEGDQWNMLPNNSCLVFLTFLQALSLELIDRLDIPFSTFKANHPGGGIGKFIKKLKI